MSELIFSRIDKLFSGRTLRSLCSITATFTAWSATAIATALPAATALLTTTAATT